METPKLRATCATDWSPCRATAITSRRNSLWDGLGTCWSFQRGHVLTGKTSTEAGADPARGTYFFVGDGGELRVPTFNLVLPEISVVGNAVGTRDDSASSSRSRPRVG